MGAADGHRYGTPLRDDPERLNGAPWWTPVIPDWPLDLRINRGDRILVTGANGSGASTLLGLLTDPSTLGSGVRLGRIDQVREVFRGSEPLVDVFGA